MRRYIYVNRRGSIHCNRQTISSPITRSWSASSECRPSVWLLPSLHLHNWHRVRRSKSHSCNDSLRSRDIAQDWVLRICFLRIVFYFCPREVGSCGLRLIFFVRPVAKEFHSKDGQDIKSGGDAKQSLCPWEVGTCVLRFWLSLRSSI